MKELAIRLWQPRVRISSLLTVSLMAMLFCFINLPIIFVGLIELAVLTGCVVLFRKVDVTQYELFQYKPHWFWRICEWYWTIYFCYFVLPFINWLGNCYPTLRYAYFIYPSIFKPLTDWAILCYGKEVAVQYLSAMMFTPILILTMPICYYCFRWLFKQVAEFFKNLTRFEIGYLTISSTILITVLLVISAKTSFFVLPIHKDFYSSYSKYDNFSSLTRETLRISSAGDLFWGADHFWFIVHRNYSPSLDNFRHPIFSTIFVHFIPLISILSYPIGFCFCSSLYSLSISICVIQIVLYVLSGIVIKRIFSNIIEKVFSLVLSLLYICSFPAVFCLLPERLIFSSFFLVLGIYTFEKNYNIKSFIAFLASAGTTILSVLPLIIIRFKQNKFCKILIMCLCLFLIVISRGFLFHVGSSRNYSESFRYCHDEGLTNQITLFNTFLCSNLFTPKWYYTNIEIQSITNNKQIYEQLFITTNIKTIRQKAMNNIFGGVMFLCCCISVVLYRNKTIVQLSFLWLIVSVIIIGIMGFGINESVLYCSYFSWAIIPLTLLPFYWLWQKFPKLPIPQALYAFVAYLAISNLYFLYQVVQIVSDRYIVPPGM